MVDKFLKINSSGDPEEQAALQSSSGVADAGKIPALDASGLISSTMLPDSGLRDMMASENVAAGDMINVWNDTGTVKIRKADASNGRAAHGFVPVGITTGNTGSVNLGPGLNNDRSGLTIGAEYFLGTAGSVTTTPPTTTGHTLQKVGVALSATELQVELGTPIKRA